MDTRTNIHVRLTGEDGNIFSIVGKVSAALKRAGRPELAAEYRDAVFASGSYDEALQITMSYVEVD